MCQPPVSLTTGCKQDGLVMMGYGGGSCVNTSFRGALPIAEQEIVTRHNITALTSQLLVLRISPDDLLD